MSRVPHRPTSNVKVHELDRRISGIVLVWARAQPALDQLDRAQARQMTSTFPDLNPATLKCICSGPSPPCQLEAGEQINRFLGRIDRCPQPSSGRSPPPPLRRHAGTMEWFEYPRGTSRSTAISDRKSSTLVAPSSCIVLRNSLWSSSSVRSTPASPPAIKPYK